MRLNKQELQAMLKNNQKIPEGWSVKKLGDIGKVSMCKRIMKHETNPISGIPFYKIGTFGGQPDAYISEKLYLEYRHKYSYPKKGDILISAAGTIGRTVVFNGENAYFQDSNIVWLANDETKALNKYLLFYYATKPWYTTTGGAISRLYNENITEAKVLLPPLAEQEKIAEILGTWDEAIEKLSSLIEQKKLIKKGLMQKLLTGKVRLPGFTQPWKEVKLGNFLKEHTEKTTENDQYQVLSVTKNGICSQEEYFEKQIASENNIGYKILRKHDIVFSPMNLWMGSIGFSEYDIGIVSPAYKIFSVNENVALFSFLKHFMIINRMIYLYLINSEQGASIVRRNLDLDGLLSSKVSIPDITEQQAIADVLSAADDEINLLNKKLEALKEQKKGLMQQLLTGQIRVKVN